MAGAAGRAWSVPVCAVGARVPASVHSGKVPVRRIGWLRGETSLCNPQLSSHKHNRPENKSQGKVLPFSPFILLQQPRAQWFITNVASLLRNPFGAKDPSRIQAKPRLVLHRHRAASSPFSALLLEFKWTGRNNCGVKLGSAREMSLPTAPYGGRRRRRPRRGEPCAQQPLGPAGHPGPQHTQQLLDTSWHRQQLLQKGPWARQSQCPQCQSSVPTLAEHRHPGPCKTWGSLEGTEKINL